MAVKWTREKLKSVVTKYPLNQRIKADVDIKNKTLKEIAEFKAVLAGGIVCTKVNAQWDLDLPDLDNEDESRMLFAAWRIKLLVLDSEYVTHISEIQTRNKVLRASYIPIQLMHEQLIAAETMIDELSGLESIAEKMPQNLHAQGFLKKLASVRELRDLCIKDIENMERSICKGLEDEKKDV